MHSSETDNPIPTSNPSHNNDTIATRSVRVLISSKEAGCIIGQNGSVIVLIREETNTKAAILKFQPGCHERILTVLGEIQDIAKAVSYFAQALLDAGPSVFSVHPHFPLKQLSPVPNKENETTTLRLLIPNAQIGSLIGTGGTRIQEFQRTCNVIVIVSKSFLPNSNERLVELQGSVDNLYDVLRLILKCIHGQSSTFEDLQLYSPRAGARRQHSNPGRLSETLLFSNSIVGALIGKNGSRIQGVRKVSGAAVAISEEDPLSDERYFTISGNPREIDKAKSLILHNLEREKLRRGSVSSADDTPE